MRRSTRTLLAAVTAAAVLASGPAAWAFWTTGGAGSASATATTLAAPTNPAASVATGSGTVQVSWVGNAAPGGGAVDGYYVQRFVGAVASPACATSPASLHTTTSCDDLAVPDGTYTYRITSVFRTWTAASAFTGAVTVANDAVAPTATITFPADGSANGASAYAAGCTPVGLCGSSADNASGVVSVKVSIRQGSGNWWGGTAFDQTSEFFVATTLGAPSGLTRAWSYPLARPADGSYTVHVQAADAAGNAQTGAVYAATSSFTVDTTGPAVTLTTVNGSAATFPLTTNAASLTSVGGACGTAAGDSATVNVAITGAGTQSGTATCTAGAWTYTLSPALTTMGTYSATATQSDGVNTGSSGARSITLDSVAPAVTLTSVNGTAATFPLTTNAASLATLGGACGTAAGDSATIDVAIAGAGTQSGTATCTAGAWSYTLSPALTAQGAYTATATQSDGANTGSSGAKSITIDRAGPAVTLTTVNGSAATFPLTTNAASLASVGGACGTAAGDSATIDITVTGAGSQTGTATCTAGAWSYTLSPALTAMGTYSATATQSDGANTGSSGAKSITLDSAGPAVTLTKVNTVVVTFPFITKVNVTSVGGACGTAAGDSATVNVTVTGVGAQTGTATCTAGAWSRTLTTALSADGVSTVTATQTDGAANTGSSGAKSITVDKTAPTVTLALAAGAVNAVFDGTVVNFNGSAAGSFKLVATVADAGSGPASAAYPVQSTSGWTHAAETVTTPAGGPYTSTTHTFTSSASTPGSYTVTASDAATNTATKVITFAADITAPTGSITAPADEAYVSGAAVAVTSSSADAGGGVASAQFQTSPTGAGTWTNLGAADTASPYGVTWNTTSGFPDGRYDLRVTTTDVFGFTFTSALVNVDVQNTAPTPTSLLLKKNGGTAGKIEADDQIIVTYSQALHVNSLCSAWPANGDRSDQSVNGNNQVTVSVADGGAANDSITVSSTTCTFKFGTINLGATGYATGGSMTFSGSSGNKSQIDWNQSARTLTITFGAKAGGTQGTVASSIATYTPDAAITNAAGVAITGTRSTANIAQF